MLLARTRLAETRLAGTRLAGTQLAVWLLLTCTCDKGLTTITVGQSAQSNQRRWSAYNAYFYNYYFLVNIFDCGQPYG